MTETPAPRNERWTADREWRRLDLAVVDRIDGISRAEVQRLIRDGHVAVDAAAVTRGSVAVGVGAVIEVVIPAPRPLSVEPERMDLSVLHEDEYLVVLDKAAGIVVHPGAGHADGTLVHGLLHHCRGELSGIGGVERPGIVHRLDRDTSGCLVVAKTDVVHRGLVDAFAGRRVDKHYRALAWGRFASSEFPVDDPIGRDPHNRKKMAIRPDGREAHTRFRVVEAFDGAADLEARLLTGRTHQIRVHLAATGHPVVGDRVYGRARPNAPVRPDRQMLHAWRLAFDHPVTGCRVEVEAPLPGDFMDIRNGLRDPLAHGEPPASLP